jgi:RNA polymerase sigma-70 factor (ECF subfamily)
MTHYLFTLPAPCVVDTLSSLIDKNAEFCFFATFLALGLKWDMGNSLDWDSVVEDLGPRLYRYFCFRFSNELADDLTQETLVRLVRKVEEGKFDAQKGTLKMLGFGIAHYVALESQKLERHDSIEEWQEVLPSSLDLEQLTIDKDMVHKLREHLHALPDLEHQVLALLVDQGLTLNEISLILQIPEGTIKSHVFRAKKRLLKMFQMESVV